MAKETVTVDNKLDEIKLENREKMDRKKKEKEEKKNKNKKSEKNKENKKGYFRQVRDEMKMVSWPTRKAVVKYSVATILMIIGMALFFILVSLLFDLFYALVQGWIG